MALEFGDLYGAGFEAALVVFLCLFALLAGRIYRRLRGDPAPRRNPGEGAR